LIAWFCTGKTGIDLPPLIISSSISWVFGCSIWSGMWMPASMSIFKCTMVAFLPCLQWESSALCYSMENSVSIISFIVHYGGLPRMPAKRKSATVMRM
jgi:hypothetical protein